MWASDSSCSGWQFIYKNLTVIADAELNLLMSPPPWEPAIDISGCITEVFLALFQGQFIFKISWTPDLLLSATGETGLPASELFSLLCTGAVVRSGLFAGLSEGLWIGVPPIEQLVPRRKLPKILLNTKLVLLQLLQNYAPNCAEWQCAPTISRLCSKAVQAKVYLRPLLRRPQR
jgi:hypothetical protein